MLQLERQTRAEQEQDSARVDESPQYMSTMNVSERRCCSSIYPARLTGSLRYRVTVCSYGVRHFITAVTRGRCSSVVALRRDRSKFYRPDTLLLALYDDARASLLVQT
jgi:hypothetical protein